MATSPVLACTAAEQHDAVLSAYLPPASQSTPARPALRTTVSTVVSTAASTADTERIARQSERAPTALPMLPPLPVLSAITAPDKPEAHGYKPLAMLAAALALMVSIALRRSGKR